MSQEARPEIGSMLVVDGTEDEQIEDMAAFISNLPGSSNTFEQKIDSLLQEGRKDEALDLILQSSKLLQNLNEKEFEPAHNLLFQLILSDSSALANRLPLLLSNISTPPSFPQGSMATLTIMTTLFNLVDNQARYPVFRAITKFSKTHNLGNILTSQYQRLVPCMDDWHVSLGEKREALLDIIAASADLGEEAKLYFLTEVLKTYSDDDESSKDLVITTLNTALSIPDRLTYTEFLRVGVVKLLEKSASSHHQLLTILCTGELSDLSSFLSSNPNFFSQSGISYNVVERKMRLLSLCSLASKAANDQVSYQEIAFALSVPQEDVEMWVIDVIRAGLVEGKLLQTTQTLLVHHSTARVFDLSHWKRLDHQLNIWREHLEGILRVVEQTTRESKSTGAPTIAEAAQDDEPER